MTSLVLGAFKVVLYLQLLGSTVAGYLMGGALVTPIAMQYGAQGSVHFASVIGALIGFLAGTLFVGYGFVLLSINNHLAHIRAGSEIGPFERMPMNRVEPQMRN